MREPGSTLPQVEPERAITPVEWSMSESPSSSPVPNDQSSSRRGSLRNSWIMGVILIIMGGIFLLRSYTSLEMNNWWALFLLIPAVGFFAAAWRRFRAGGEFRKRGFARQIIFGLLFMSLSITFFLELGWKFILPVLLLLLGVGAILR